jgi:hypothetical protein
VALNATPYSPLLDFKEAQQKNCWSAGNKLGFYEIANTFSKNTLE